MLFDLSLTYISSGKWANLEQTMKKIEKKFYSQKITEISKAFYICRTNLHHSVKNLLNFMDRPGTFNKKEKNYNHRKTEISKKILYFYLKTEISKKIYVFTV